MPGLSSQVLGVTHELLLLHIRVTVATELCGFVRDTRPYQPHITLARGKGKGQRQALRELKTKVRPQPYFTRFVAEEFLLYESFLGPAGSRYEIRRVGKKCRSRWSPYH